MLEEARKNWQYLPTCKSRLVGLSAFGMKPSSKASKKRKQLRLQLERQAEPVRKLEGHVSKGILQLPPCMKTH